MGKNEILVIGSEGFIGSNLVHHFLKKEWIVTGIDHLDNPVRPYNYYKLLNISETSELLKSGNFQYIVNAAGSGNVGYSVNHPMGDFESNCFETSKVLDAIRYSGVKSSYLHISSAAVYGNPNQIPVKEESDIKPLSPYGWHKYISEILCKEYFEIYGVRSCIIRPFSVYGPGLRKQLFWDIFTKRAGKSEVELFGTGNESRDFIYIDDLVSVIELILQKADMKAECYNVANGTEVTISESATMFLNHFPGNVSVRFNGQVRTGDPLRWCADISKIRKLGYTAKMDISKGLELTYSWMKSFRDRL